MKYVNIAVLLVGLVLFSGVAAATVKASTVVSIDDWGVLTVPDSITIRKGEQKTLIASDNYNNLSEYLAPFGADWGNYYQVSLKNNEHFYYGFLTTQVVGLLTLQRLGLIGDDTTAYLKNPAAYFPAFMKAINTYMGQTSPVQYTLVKPFVAKKQNGRVCYDGCVQYTTIVNGSEYTELIYLTVIQRQSYIVVTALGGNSDDAQDFLLPLMNMVQSVK